MPVLQNPLRDLYLVLAGFLDEVYRDYDMLSGGPFDMEGFPETAKYLLKMLMGTPDISEDVKKKASEHYHLCLAIYEKYSKWRKAVPESVLAKHADSRRDIEEMALKTAGLN